MADNSPKKWFKLEESFFNGVDQKLLEKLRKAAAAEQQATAIQRITGLSDLKLCQSIAELNISVESLTALTLAPMVAVAWADDRVQDDERFQLLKAAEKAGIKRGDPSHELLESWLARRPPLDLFDTWVEYAKTLSQSLDGEARQNLRKNVLAQVRDVAEANGGILRFGSVSPTEKKMIERIEAALA